MWDHKMSESIIGAGEQIALQQCKINLIQLFFGASCSEQIALSKLPYATLFFTGL